MKCEKCQADITPENRYELNGCMLCEDCYMDALSPPRTCDPWAVYTAKSFGDSEAGGKSSLSENQQRILDFLKTRGEVAPDEIEVALLLKPGDIERDIAALRHMEKIKGALVDGRRVIRVW